MLRSMTGYGRAQQTAEGRDILVEFKAVNHRYFEFTARTPRAYGYLDERLKALAAGEIARGKVEVNVSIFTPSGNEGQVEINRALAGGYVEALRSLRDELSLMDDLSLSVVGRFPDVFQVRRPPEDEEAVWAAVRPVAEEALSRFVLMRETEGERMGADVSARLDAIEEAVGKVELRSPETAAAYKARLYEKIREVLDNRAVDEQRVLTEVALFADRIAVDEETVRLRSHIRQFRKLLTGKEPAGRKLDFLVQEMNREVNTIGSKCQDLEITNLVLSMKAELEKIREQIQNIE